MTQGESAWLRHQQQRWLRPDAARWIRPDAARFLAPGADVAEAFPALSRKYNPNQPRVPAGDPGGGQWTDGSVAGDASGLGLFQITPNDNTVDGVQLAGELPPGIDPGVPGDEPPPIPPERPGTYRPSVVIHKTGIKIAVATADLMKVTTRFTGDL